MFADGDTDGVVVEADRDVGIALLQPAPQREVAPRWDVQRRNLAGRPSHRSPAADTYANDLAIVAGIVEPVKQREDRTPQTLGADNLTHRCVHPPSCEHPPARVHDPGGELCPTDVEYERRRLRHRHLSGPGSGISCQPPGLTHAYRTSGRVL